MFGVLALETVPRPVAVFGDEKEGLRSEQPACCRWEPRQAPDHPRWPTRLPHDLRLVPREEVTGGFVAVATARDLHRHPPVRSPAAILEGDIEQDEALLLGLQLAVLGPSRGLYAGRRSGT